MDPFHVLSKDRDCWKHYKQERFDVKDENLLPEVISMYYLYYVLSTKGATTEELFLLSMYTK